VCFFFVLCAGAPLESISLAAALAADPVSFQHPVWIFGATVCAGVRGTVDGGIGIDRRLAKTDQKSIPNRHNSRRDRAFGCKPKGAPTAPRERISKKRLRTKGEKKETAPMVGS